MVFVIAKDGTRLMPTTPAKARILLKKKKAVIHSRNPFTIQLCYESEKNTQPIEYCCDTGYVHVGVSIKSEKHEIVSAQYDLLNDESEQIHMRSKYRRTRRNRLRHRKCRFKNRKVEKGWLAPSIKHRMETQIRIFDKYNKVCPITDAYFEMGKFDTQLLAATEAGKPAPQGVDYQHGEAYGYANLREAVFARDNYKCAICGKVAFIDDAILRIHHVGYRIGDRSNRMDNLLTVCTKCHNSKNHQKGGKLYNLKPKHKSFKGETYMTSVRWKMIELLKEQYPDVNISYTYGSETKLRRRLSNIEKTHTNDAYVMGNFRPKHRAHFQHFIKRRRNNRILSKFTDAKYIDTRDGEIKSGKELFNGRTTRNKNRNTENQRQYRKRIVVNGKIKHKGRVSVRKQRYSIRPHDVVIFNNKKYIASGVHNEGANVILKGFKSVNVKFVTVDHHIGGWYTEEYVYGERYKNED